MTERDAGVLKLATFASQQQAFTLHGSDILLRWLRPLQKKWVYLVSLHLCILSNSPGAPTASYWHSAAKPERIANSESHQRLAVFLVNQAASDSENRRRQASPNGGTSSLSD
jgi:hypothetical protein